VLSFSYLFPHLFRKIFAKTKQPVISETILNFENQIIPIFAKVQNRKIPSFAGPYSKGYDRVDKLVQYLQTILLDKKSFEIQRCSRITNLSCKDVLKLDENINLKNRQF